MSWQWNLGNGSTSTAQNPSASYTSPGTYKVTLTVKDASGASHSTEKTVTVWANPKPDFTASPAKGCIPFEVQFTGKSDPVNGTITTQSWDYGDGITGDGNNPVHVYRNVLKPTVTLTVTNSNGCTASKVIPNIVDAGAALVADFNLNTQNVCTAPGTVTITNASSGPGALTYSWDFGDGKTATGANPGSHTYTAKGVYKIKLTVSNDRGCVASKTSENINVANFTTEMETGAVICENSQMLFTAKTTPAADNITWSVDKGSMGGWGTSAYLYPLGAGQIKVTMTADYGSCRETITRDFVVNPTPKAEFTMDKTLFCDVPATIKITDKSTGASTGAGISVTDKLPPSSILALPIAPWDRTISS